MRGRGSCWETSEEVTAKSKVKDGVGQNHGEGRGGVEKWVGSVSSLVSVSSYVPP